MKKSFFVVLAVLLIAVCLGFWYVRREKDNGALIVHLGDRDATTRLQASEALIKRGSSAVPELTRALTDKQDQVRIGAATALGRIGPDASGSIPALTEALNDKHKYVRAEAAKALSRMGKMAGSAVQPLCQAMVDEDMGVRHNAAEALARIGPVAFPSLIEGMRHENKHVRIEAAYGLGLTGDDATEEICLVLADALKDPDRDVRQFAAQSLGKIGPAAKLLLPALIETLKDEDQLVRVHAANALSLIDPTHSAEAIPVLNSAKVDQITGIMVSEALHRISQAMGTDSGGP
jgi:HEAT repeat protein